MASSALLSNTPVLDNLGTAYKNRLVYTLLDDLSVLYGPFVDERPASEDPNTYLAGVVANLTPSLAAGELAADLVNIETDGSLATVSTKYATLAQIRTALRAAYAVATRTQAIMLGDFLSSLTDAQLQALFSMTQAQVTNLRSTKLTPAANAAATIRAATGA